MEVSRGGWEDNSGIGFPPIRAFVGGGQSAESPPGSCWMHQVLTAQDAGEGYCHHTNQIQIWTQIQIQTQIKIEIQWAVVQEPRGQLLDAPSRPDRTGCRRGLYCHHTTTDASCLTIKYKYGYRYKCKYKYGHKLKYIYIQKYRYRYQKEDTNTDRDTNRGTNTDKNADENTVWDAKVSKRPSLARRG